MPRERNATAAVRAGIATDRHHNAVVPPIHLSSTFAFDGFDQKGRYDYTRSGNPTRDILAEAIAELEGGSSAVITSSGMSAVALVLQLLKPGDLVLATHDCYGGTHRLLTHLAKRGLFDVEFADLGESARAGHAPPLLGSSVIPSAAARRAAESRNPLLGDRQADPSTSHPLRGCSGRDDVAPLHSRPPKLVWIETPSNPLLRITDIAAVAEHAHAAGALVVVDNTFLSPAWQQPIEHGADIVVHSTTKYINGHSDVVGGAVIARDAALGEELAWWANALGITGAPFDSYLTLRGLRTLDARCRVHAENAAAVVAALAEHPAVAKVWYPGLADHPGHDIACRQQSGFGAMVSFELHGAEESVRAFLDGLECFTLAESLGGVESLVAHPATMTHVSMGEEGRRNAGISDTLLRLSVGIERAEDLVADLRQGLLRVERSAATAVVG
ncbi:MAG TPA: PLP-dependent transferase [Gemmatimonadales bacterium]|nr:PLP-dependent transferase [Gemmatimonadales bacterium]